ncbi:MAG: pyridoxal-phosphate dependent enzyme [Candidatus Eiseniibacteriota bacterium]|nr:MAG: pyridoxal-phosphate dependent enzyme [Candidatus Eisenbacteria bacterium]
MTADPTIEDIRTASERIRSFIHCTPVLTCEALNRMSGASLFFKCENFQKAGVFKIRGAANAVFSLREEDVSNGVATHSSGNHAAALALAAHWRGTRAFVVMPRTAPGVKKEAVAGYGAEIVFCEPTLRSREETLGEVVARTGAVVVHPYNDHRVICGQGTAALELCQEVSELDVVMTPVGGGGLVSGTAIVVSSLSPRTEVVAAEPERADDAYRSLQAGRILPSENPDTIADGLLTSLGDLTFPIIQRHVRNIVTVSEESIVAGMRCVWERMKVVIEPSAAVPVGALLGNRELFAGKRVGVILSGGNADLTNLPWVR